MKLPVYARIDLNKGICTSHKISEEDVKKYYGGKILAVKLLMDVTIANLDPYDERAAIIINTGPMNGTGAPSSSRFNMTFKNTLTGGIATSNCGGTFGFKLKRAGFDGLILLGKCEELSAIFIEDGKVNIKNCPELAGLDTEETQANFPKYYGKLVIGPAGENLVRYACAVSGERVAGRCGAGAVLGAKNIKGIFVYGTEKIEIADNENFKKYIKKWSCFIKKHPMTGDTLPHYGTAVLVKKANAASVLPTGNYKKGQFEGFEEISGEKMAETVLVKNSGCVSCPIRCERRVKFGDKEIKGPEFETVGLFGANIENNNLEFINEVNYFADKMGMDTISLAGTIAFAMELKEKNIKNFGIEFGKTDNLLQVIEKIAWRKGEEYSQLAEGVKWLSENYGGKDFAIHSKGLELASYEPRRSVGMGLGYATSNRGGCHLNGGYLALMESVGVIGMNPQTTKGKAELTVFFQNAMEAVSAAGFCLFTLQTVVPAFLFTLEKGSFLNRLVGKLMLMSSGILRNIWKHLPGLLPFNSMYLLPHCEAMKYAMGIDVTMGSFLQVGERGFNLEKLYNRREGLTFADDSLPRRLTSVPQVEDDPDTIVSLREMLPKYYSARGWNDAAVPTNEKLKKLELK